MSQAKPDTFRASHSVGLGTMTARECTRPATRVRAASVTAMLVAESAAVATVSGSTRSRMPGSVPPCAAPRPASAARATPTSTDDRRRRGITGAAFLTMGEEGFEPPTSCV